MIYFSKRSDEKEWLDDLNLDGPQLEANLKEIAWINRNLGGLSITLDGIKTILVKHPKDEVLRIADLGCGGGDALKKIAVWARKHNKKVELFGVDANPNVITFAKRYTKDFPEITYFAADLFSEEVAQLNLDVVLCGLFLHHLKDQEIENFLAQCQKRNWALVINDLQRSRIAYVLFLLVSKLLRFSKASQHDGAISIKRSFIKSDLIGYLRQNKISSYNLKWKWAFRYQMIVWPQNKI